MPDAHSKDVVSNAAAEARVWEGHAYYETAEPYMEEQWNALIKPFIDDCDFSVVVDLAAGHGRNSLKLLERTKRLYIVDVLQSNLDYCRQRFGDNPKITYLKTTGFDVQAIPDASVTLVYCWDAMVHFDSDIVRNYLAEFRRILRPAGRAFSHHSNWTGNPGGFESKDAKGIGPERRNFMSKELYAHYAIKEGLEVVRQRVITWNTPDLDCLSLVARPSSEAVGGVVQAIRAFASRLTAYAGKGKAGA
jgi:SAM-dependent methyltransferase